MRKKEIGRREAKNKEGDKEEEENRGKTKKIITRKMQYC